MLCLMLQTAFFLENRTIRLLQLASKLQKYDGEFCIGEVIDAKYLCGSAKEVQRDRFQVTLHG